MTHTPGPWQLGHKLAFPELHLSVHEKDGWTIADCDMRIRTVEENEANARLIATAPRLLKRLQECRRAIASLPNDALGMANAPDGRYQWPIRDELLVCIDKDIQAATGNKK